MPDPYPADEPIRAPFSSATVRRQFDRHAARFAERDFVIREVDRRLQERLDPIRLEPRRILDLGCGAGASRAALLERFPQAEWIGLDQSTALLARIERTGALARWLGRHDPPRIGADAAALPLGDGTVDLVFSNLMPHWHPRPPAVFAECRRVLAVGGLIAFSSFGPDTLKELRAACAAALPQAAPLPCVDMHDYGDMLVAAGFSTPVMDAEFLRLTYADPRQLLREVVALGSNPRDDRPQGLPGSRAAHALCEALGARRDPDGRIGLTLELVYGHAWRLKSREPGVSRVGLDALRGQLRDRRES